MQSNIVIRLTAEKSFEDVISDTAGMTLKTFEDHLDRTIGMGKEKLQLLGVPNDRLMNEIGKLVAQNILPTFANLSKSLEKGMNNFMVSCMYN